MNDYDAMIEMLARAGIEFERETHVDPETVTPFTEHGYRGLWVLTGDGPRHPVVILGFDVDGSLKRIDTDD
jgi:hypothetical protein